MPLRIELSLQSLSSIWFIALLEPLFLSLKPSKGQFVFLPVTPALLQFKDILPCSIYKSAMDKKKLPSDTFPKGLLIPMQDYLFLEPVHNVVSKHHQLKPTVVPSPTLGYYIVKAKGVNPLFDKVLTKSPYLHGSLGTVGGNHLIVVYSITPLYEGKLLLRSFTLSYLCPDDDQTTGYGLTQEKKNLFCRDAPGDRFPASLIRG